MDDIFYKKLKYQLAREIFIQFCKDPTYIAYKEDGVSVDEIRDGYWKSAAEQSFRAAEYFLKQSEQE